RDRARKGETEQRRSVVDLPSRHDHQDHRHRIDPVRNAYPRRLNDLRRGGYGMLVAGCKAGHCFSWLFPGGSVANRHTRLYAGDDGFVTSIRLSGRYSTGIAVTKKRAGLPRLAVAHPVGTEAGRARGYDGIRTV